MRRICGYAFTPCRLLGAPLSAIDRSPACNLNATTRSPAGSASRAVEGLQASGKDRGAYGEDRGATGEDEEKRRVMKTEAPQAKMKTSEECRRPRRIRRRSRRQRRRQRSAKRGEDQVADCEVEDQQRKASESKRFGSREGNCSPNGDERVWA